MRYLLDTNVVAELRRGRRADPAVLAWRKGLRTSQSCLSAITLLELSLGIALKARKDEEQCRAERCATVRTHRLSPHGTSPDRMRSGGVGRIAEPTVDRSRPKRERQAGQR